MTPWIETGVDLVARECPLWVINGHFVTTLRMSAFGGKADINHLVPQCPLIAKSGSLTAI